MKWFEIRNPQEKSRKIPQILPHAEHLDGPEFPKSLGRFSQTIRYVKGGADAAEASEELTLLTLD